MAFRFPLLLAFARRYPPEGGAPTFFILSQVQCSVVSGCSVGESAGFQQLISADSLWVVPPIREFRVVRIAFRDGGSPFQVDLPGGVRAADAVMSNEPEPTPPAITCHEGWFASFGQNPAPSRNQHHCRIRHRQKYLRKLH